MLQWINAQLILPNNTSHIQPMDAGIIAALKSNYRRLLSFLIFENIDAKVKGIYDVEILSAMRWVEEEWNGMSVDAINHYWKHCFEKPLSLNGIV